MRQLKNSHLLRYAPVLCFALVMFFLGAAQVSAATFSSPRETMRFYLKHIVAHYENGSQEDLKKASTVFDLSGFPQAEQDLQGQKRARIMIKILDRLERIDVDRQFPNAKQLGKNATTWSYYQSPPKRSDIEITLQFSKQSNGSWLIDRETVAQVLPMFHEVKTLQPLEGLEKSLTLPETIRYKWVPNQWQKTRFILEDWQWLGLLGLIFLGVLCDFLARSFFLKVFFLKLNIKRIELNKEDLENFEKPLGLMAISGVLFLGIKLLDIEPKIYVVLDIAASLVFVVATVWATYELVDVVCGVWAEKAKKTETKIDDVLIPLIRRTLKLIILVIGFIFIASRLTPNLWSIFAGLSIGSLAIGFAAKDSIENLFGTFTVLTDKPFELGDWIQLDDIDGNVEEVGFRSTRIRTFYNSLITVPNSRFISSPVDNMGARRYRRIKTMLSLTYDTPPEKIEAFCEGVRQMIKNHPHTRKDYFHVYLNSFSASSLDILLYCFLETPDWGTELREKHRLYADIIRLAANLKVSFAFPTQSIHMVKPEDLLHSNNPNTVDEAKEVGKKQADLISKGVSYE